MHQQYSGSDQCPQLRDTCFCWRKHYHYRRIDRWAVIYKWLVCSRGRNLCWPSTIHHPFNVCGWACSAVYSNHCRATCGDAMCYLWERRYSRALCNDAILRGFLCSHLEQGNCVAEHDPDSHEPAVLVTVT